MKCEVVKLSDVCDLIAGFAFKSKDFGDFEDKVIKIADIVPPRVEMKGLRGVNLSNYNKDKLEKFIAKPGDYVLAMTGATIGKIGRIYEKSAYINQRVLLFRPRKEIDKDFLYYTICAKSFYDYIISFVDSETAQPNISATTIGKYKLYLPDLNTQKKIASILQSLDNKIELNNKINKNLEQQAQAIYQEWFTNRAESDWQQGHLSDLVIVRYGKDHKKLADGAFPVFGSGGLMRRVERPLYNKESVLIPRKGTLNNVMYINEPFWSVDTMFYTEMKLSNVAKFVYHFLKSKDLASMNAGSAVPSMTTDILNALELPIPSSDTLATFENAVSPMYSAMQHNARESTKLAELRDILLPKLMNGEIEIDGI